MDETKKSGLLVVAAIGTPPDLNVCRKTLRELTLPGQRRIHFAKERDSRRRSICSAIADMPVEIRAYDARRLSDQRTARALVLDAIVRDRAEIRAQRLIIEQDDSLIVADRRVLHQARRDHRATELNYEHARAAEEPLLCIPDAAAWCLAKGGDWPRRIARVMEPVTRIGS